MSMLSIKRSHGALNVEPVVSITIKYPLYTRTCGITKACPTACICQQDKIVYDSWFISHLLICGRQSDSEKGLGFTQLPASRHRGEWEVICCRMLEVLTALQLLWPEGSKLAHNLCYCQLWWHQLTCHHYISLTTYLLIVQVSHVTWV